jgi:hypothetical protein
MWHAGPAEWPDRLLDALADLPEPLLFVVDDAHHLTAPECAALMLRLASGLARPHHLVVAARRLHERLEPLRAVPGAAQLGPADIAFSPDETARLAEALTGTRPRDEDLQALVEATGGWASAVLLAAPARGGTLPRGDRARGMGGLVECFLGRLPEAEHGAVTQLAHLPYLSPQVADAVTGHAGLFGSMVGAGLPLARTATGWWELPGPVAAHLARRSRLEPGTATAAAAAYAAHGDLVLALRLLAGSGLPGQAASLIESLAPAEIEELGWAEIRAVAEALPERTLDRHPRLLLQLSRVAETGYRMDVRREALDRARRIVGDGGVDPPLRRELDAERARDLVWDETTRGQARALAMRDEWLYACASWSQAELSSLSGDRAATVRAVLDVHRHRAAWFDETPGIEFLAQAADYLDRVGEHQMAAEHLGRARSRMAGFERVVRVYEAAVLGRSGDPAEAEEIISATLARPDLDPQERWPIMVLRAYAALRRGDPAARTLAASAFDTCRALGVPEGPLRREPDAAEALLPAAAAVGSAAAADLLDGAATFSVSLFGEFEVRRRGRHVDLPAGRPARAVRAVAACGGMVHAEQLIDMLSDMPRPR